MCLLQSHRCSKKIKGQIKLAIMTGFEIWSKKAILQLHRALPLSPQREGSFKIKAKLLRLQQSTVEFSTSVNCESSIVMFAQKKRYAVMLHLLKSGVLRILLL